MLLHLIDRLNSLAVSVNVRIYSSMLNLSQCLWALRTFVLCDAILLGAILSFAVPAAADCRPSDTPLSQAVGAWRAEDGSPFLVVQPYRLLIQDEETLSVLPVRDVNNGEVLIVHENRQRRLPFVLQDQKLMTTSEPGAEPEPFVRSAREPRELFFEPVSLGEMRPLTEERTQQIQKQIDDRMQEDQRALQEKIKSKAEPGEVEQITAANTAYLLRLTQDVGWIDRERFGLKTAHQAVILAQHSGHVPLALAALPYVEKDFKKAADSPETYPVFVDWLNLALGDCQRYGSRIELDESGAPVLAPLEDLEAIDAIRAEQGMSPLQEYLALAGQYLFDGQEIQRPMP